jgi:hypothetical protein
MPRTIDEIMSQADQLAARFEGHEPDRGSLRDATALRAVRKAFLARAASERRVTDAVAKARAEGHSWAAIGAMVGTSGEAARQRYGQRTPIS